MPDTQGARIRFIRARTTTRQRDANSSGANGEPGDRVLERSAAQRMKYRFGFKRRHQTRPRTDDREVISKLDQIPNLELRETRLAAWLEAMLEYEIERNH